MRLRLRPTCTVVSDGRGDNELAGQSSSLLQLHYAAKDSCSANLLLGGAYESALVHWSLWRRRKPEIGAIGRSAADCGSLERPADRLVGDEVFLSPMIGNLFSPPNRENLIWHDAAAAASLWSV